jgi:hypothetical protein
MNSSQIDSVILSIVGEHWTKVAMVIARVENAMGHDLPPGDEGYEVISGRIEALVHDGRLAAQGDTKNWRFSEVRLRPESMRQAVLRYLSGEEIKKGDRVLFHGNPAEIELVSTDPNDPEQAWHVSEFGGGVLISDPMVSGRTFVPRDQLDEYEDLEFVSRAGS